MPAVRTIAKPPLSDSVVVRIPEEYRSYSLEILVVPVAVQNDSTPRPTWAGLCEDSISRNMDGPHDMDSIRKSVEAASRLETV